MKFLADECCDVGLVSSLREDGHDVLYVLDLYVLDLYVLEKKPGASDDEIILDAYNENRILQEEKTVNKKYILAHNSICLETGAFKRIKDRGGRKID